MSPNPPVFTGIRRALLGWYRRCCRKLPWRAEPTTAGRQRVYADPYHVLVSETMLQQTQVATVIDYFHRFMARFPTIQELAAAPEQDVLRLWQGLGYYHRARNLHAAAKVIVERHGGQVPSDVDDLLELPGVGRYTAGAIASIAFGKAAPILDGNVARVLARWTAMREAIDEPAVRTRLWELAQAAVPAKNPGDFNQAMMELGALVCTPRNPQCLACPVAKWCKAYQKGLQQEIPVRLPRQAPRAVTHQIVAIQRGREYLWQQRPGKGLWPGMWELPTLEQAASPEELVKWLRQRTGMVITQPTIIGRFAHQTSHRKIEFVLWQADAKGGRLPDNAGLWRKLDALENLPLANPQRRAAEWLAGLL